jgi:hypothetical protein
MAISVAFRAERGRRVTRKPRNAASHRKSLRPLPRHGLIAVFDGVVIFFEH